MNELALHETSFKHVKYLCLFNILEMFYSKQEDGSFSVKMPAEKLERD